MPWFRNTKKTKPGKKKANTFGKSSWINTSKLIFILIDKQKITMEDAMDVRL